MTGSSQLRGRRSGRAVLIVVIVVAVALVGGLAWFSEPLGAMIRLKTWDKDAPAKVVLSFLEAVKSNDQQAAQQYLGSDQIKPLIRGGKWVGFSKPTGSFFINYFNKEMLPKDPPAHPRVEFMTVGEGAADVFMPNRSGKEEKWRLEMRPQGWRLTELGGAKRG
jgi:hypothetical protein